MTDSSVQGFYSKNAADGYAAQYEIDHGPRLDAMIARFGLASLKGQRVLDVGGGLGFLGKRLDPSNDYWVLDGAQIAEEQRLCRGTWVTTDLDRHTFGSEDGDNCLARKPQWDVAFILETLEHCISPYNVLAEVKKLVKPDGVIYISLPHENVWHNAIYAGLLWPPQNWEQFLGQMALPIADRWLWDRGWNARHWKCINRPYREKVMLYPKQEAKFLDATPVQMVNW